MLTQTVTQSTTTQDQIFNLLSICNWNKVKHQVKFIYQAAKQTMTESEREELLLDIFLDTLILDDYSTYWNFMNR